MSKVEVLDLKGKKKESLDLDSKVFDGKVNKALLHQAVVTYLANQRKGLASAKTKGEVSGGGRKPWRQKGTGRARVGSSRSPLWKGGGVTFGPKPHSYRKDLPKKMKVLALKSALNAKFKDKEIVVLDKLEVSTHKTKDFLKIVKSLKLDKTKACFIVENVDNNLKLSCRNLGKVSLNSAGNLNTYEALDCKNIVFTKDALGKVTQRIKKFVK
jgi:large subunit ribosomal protein L4